MKNIINIAFYEYDKKTINLIDIVDKCVKAQDNNLFFANININEDKVLYIFSEYEMQNKTYELLNKIYNSDEGFSIIIDNMLEDENIKYNIIDL